MKEKDRKQVVVWLLLLLRSSTAVVSYDTLMYTLRSLYYDIGINKMIANNIQFRWIFFCRVCTCRVFVFFLFVGSAVAVTVHINILQSYFIILYIHTYVVRTYDDDDVRMCIWLRCETNTTTTITSGTYLFDHKMKIFFARCRETFVSFALPFFDQIKILFSCRCRRRRPSSSLSPVAHFDELHYDFHEWKINGHSLHSHCLSTAEYCFVFASIMRFVCFLETVWWRHGMRGRER